MYNPSNHIPLSKPLGAAAFPIDGKFMFYTNGVGGVYSYRPFQSVQEVLDYFPLGSNFRGNAAGQAWSFEVLVNTGGTLSSDGGSIVGGVNDVYWWRNGVADADLVLKASSGGSGLKTESYNESDLQFDPILLQYFLPVTLESTELVLAVSSDVSGTKDQIQFSLTDNKIFGFPDNSTQNIIVKIG